MDIAGEHIPTYESHSSQPQKQFITTKGGILTDTQIDEMQSDLENLKNEIFSLQGQLSLQDSTTKAILDQIGSLSPWQLGKFQKTIEKGELLPSLAAPDVPPKGGPQLAIRKASSEHFIPTNVDISRLESRITELQSTINDRDSKISAFEVVISALEVEISSFPKDWLKQLEEDNSDLEETVKSLIKELEAKEKSHNILITQISQLDIRTIEVFKKEFLSGQGLPLTGPTSQETPRMLNKNPDLLDPADIEQLQEDNRELSKLINNLIKEMGDKDSYLKEILAKVGDLSP